MNPRTLTPSAKKMLTWELLERGVPVFLGRSRKRLGDVCVVTAGGSRVCGADATAISGSLAQTNPNAVTGATMFATTYPSYFQNGGIQSLRINPGSGPAVPSVTSLLAQAQAVYNSNPAALTQNQWALLQSAGIIPSTLPYSSASQLPNSQTAALAAVPTATTGDIMLGSFDLTAFVGSVPWWGWALGAGGLLFAFSGPQKRGRR